MTRGTGVTLISREPHVSTPFTPVALETISAVTPVGCPGRLTCSTVLTESGIFSALVVIYSFTPKNVYFYCPQRCCGKLMFLQQSVILFTAGSLSGRLPLTETLLDRETPGQRPSGQKLSLDRDPPDRDPPGKRPPSCGKERTGRILLESLRWHINLTLSDFT